MIRSSGQRRSVRYTLSVMLRGVGSIRLVVCCWCFLVMAACSTRDHETAPAPSGSVAPAAVILRQGVTFSANPDPIVGQGNTKLGKTTLSWKTPVQSVQIRIGSADGKLFSTGAGAQQAETGIWVTNGMTFYLQDNTAPNPTDSSATLAKLTVAVK
jgi:hypothetical protein